MHVCTEMRTLLCINTLQFPLSHKRISNVKEAEQVLTLHRLFQFEVRKAEIHEIHSENNLAHAVQSHSDLDSWECKTAMSNV